MRSLADRTVTALRATHDELLSVLSGLSDEALLAPSGASEWSVARVLSHLGSGGEIGLAGLRATLAGEPAPEQELNESVWDRWDALSPREQADGFRTHETALLEAFEALTPEQRSDVVIELGFLPFPLPLAAVLGMRLNELALHAWDVKVAVDPAAEVNAAAADVVGEQLITHLGFLVGFTGKTDATAGRRITLDVPNAKLTLEIADAVSIVAPTDAPTATLTAPNEAVVRLLNGRLKPEHTPSSVEVTGNVTLEELRVVFPGY